MSEGQHQDDFGEPEGGPEHDAAVAQALENAFGDKAEAGAEGGGDEEGTQEPPPSDEESGEGEKPKATQGASVHLGGDLSISQDQAESLGSDVVKAIQDGMLLKKDLTQRTQEWGDERRAFQDRIAELEEIATGDGYTSEEEEDLSPGERKLSSELKELKGQLKAREEREAAQAMIDTLKNLAGEYPVLQVEESQRFAITYASQVLNDLSGEGLKIAAQRLQSAVETHIKEGKRARSKKAKERRSKVPAVGEGGPAPGLKANEEPETLAQASEMALEALQSADIS